MTRRTLARALSDVIVRPCNRSSPMPLSTIGIIGAGTMGSGIAQVSATAGLNVILVDVTAAAIDKGVAIIVRNLARLVAKGKMSATEKDAAVGRITRSIAYDDL